MIRPVAHCLFTGGYALEAAEAGEGAVLGEEAGGPPFSTTRPASSATMRRSCGAVRMRWATTRTGLPFASAAMARCTRVSL